MAQVLVALSPVWETCIEFLALSLDLPWLFWAFNE